MEFGERENLAGGEPMKIYKLSMIDNPKNFMVFKAEGDMSHILDDLEYMDIDDGIQIVVGKMTDEEFKNLPEHPGW